MDVLSDFLKSTGVSRAMIKRSLLEKYSGFKFPCEKSMGFHFIAQGTAFFSPTNQKKLIELSRGDLLLVRPGYDHKILTDRKASLKQFSEIPEKIQNSDKSSFELELISGLYFMKYKPFHPIFDELPRYIHFKSSDIRAGSTLAVASQLLSAEANREGGFNSNVTNSLVDLIFNYVLQEWLDERAQMESSWARAYSDIYLKPVLEAIHTDFSRGWNLLELSKLSGLGRSAFSSRFKSLTGESPAKYLLRVRAQKAMELLSDSDMSIEKIAEEVGYKDGFTFSKAFSRVVGNPPSDFRKKL